MVGGGWVLEERGGILYKDLSIQTLHAGNT